MQVTNRGQDELHRGAGGGHGRQGGAAWRVPGGARKVGGLYARSEAVSGDAEDKRLGQEAETEAEDRCDQVPDQPGQCGHGRVVRARDRGLHSEVKDYKCSN